MQLTWTQRISRRIAGKSLTQEVICFQWLQGKQYKLVRNFDGGFFWWMDTESNQVSKGYGTEEMARVHFGEWFE